MKKAVSKYKALSKVTGCCIFFVLCAVSVQAQTRGKVEVVKDSRMDTLVAKWTELNSKTKTQTLVLHIKKV
ncbi:MAG: hypothetical protein EOO07_15180 [Chitinophagaceae bacterium]|nr:MAG: hypothetical protein EOO07_15180 [Chitinophagaceae bacterium]